MRLSPANTIPSLTSTDFLGRPVDLHALRGRRVMLSFYRYASCPVCNFRMHVLIQAYPRLSAAGLELVAVFQSSPESISQYVGRQDAPFAIVADPTMALYRRFGVETHWASMLSLKVIGTALRAFGKGFLPGRIEGPAFRTPADFLIEADGRIAVAHYGSHIDDHIALGEIEQWLQSPVLKAAA
ncbi:MAG: peroxiredoxin-like family protein [Pseudomonadota bacterium]